MSENTDRLRVGDMVAMYRRGRKATWVADFWHGGQHRRQSLRTANKKVALARALKIDAELSVGTFQGPPPVVTFQQAVGDYMEYLETEGRARKTIVRYRGILNSLTECLRNCGCVKVSQFTAILFDRFRADRKEKHHVKTMYTEAVVVKQLMKWLRTRRLIAHNPIADFKLKKPPREPRGGPTLTQINEILADLSEPQRSQIAVLSFTGMRAGELQRLQVGDIDLEGNWIHIWSRPGAETKSRMSRKVPLHPRLRSLLAALPPSRQPWLFTMPPSPMYREGGHQLNVKKLNASFKRIAERRGLPVGRDSHGYTLHSLRHFFETFAVNNRVPQRAVDAWLGHRADQSMAANYYRLSDDDSQRFMSEVPFLEPACQQPMLAKEA